MLLPLNRLCSVQVEPSPANIEAIWHCFTHHATAYPLKSIPPIRATAPMADDHHLLSGLFFLIAIPQFPYHLGM